MAGDLCAVDKLYLTKKKQRNMPRKQLPRESEIQHECVEWFRANYPDCIMFSVPNEAARTRFSVYEYSGALKGAPDTVVVMPCGVFFVEFKAKYGKQSPEQVAFEAAAVKLGVGYHLCRSLEDFKAVIAAEQERFAKDAFSGCLTLTEVPKFYT
jgi:hypothetical protein